MELLSDERNLAGYRPSDGGKTRRRQRGMRGGAIPVGRVDLAQPTPGTRGNRECQFVNFREAMFGATASAWSRKPEEVVE